MRGRMLEACLADFPGELFPEIIQRLKLQSMQERKQGWGAEILPHLSHFILAPRPNVTAFQKFISASH